MFKSKWPWFLIGFLLVAGIIATIAFKRSSKYEFVTPRRGSITEAIYGLGKVKTYKKYDVKIGVMSTVEKIYAREGDVVKKGQPLIRFAESLMFHSPLNGTVTFLGVDEAEAVAPQMAIMSVKDLTNRYIEVSLEQQGALRVQKNQKADVIFESLRGEKLAGRVKALFPKNDEFLAHIQVDGLMDNVLPGMTADVSITVGEHENVLLVPVSSLVNGHITIIRNDEKTKVPIKVGGIDGEWAEVIEGDIRDDDQVMMKASAEKK